MAMVGARWVVAAGLVLTAVVAGPGPVASDTPDFVVIGDSLTAGNVSLIRARVEAAGITSVRYEAVSGRRIARAVRYRDGIRRSSGIEVVRRLHQQGVDPRVWVIELGANDIHTVSGCGCPAAVETAGALIDSLVAEIGPDEPIAWVTVLVRTAPAASRSFNEAIRRRAAVDPLFVEIDWYGRSVDHPEWYADHVHPNRAGVGHFSTMYAENFQLHLDDPLDVPRAGRPVAARVERDGFGLGDLAR